MNQTEMKKQPFKNTDKSVNRFRNINWKGIYLILWTGYFTTHYSGCSFSSSLFLYRKWGFFCPGENTFFSVTFLTPFNHGSILGNMADGNLGKEDGDKRDWLFVLVVFYKHKRLTSYGSKGFGWFHQRFMPASITLLLPQHHQRFNKEYGVDASSCGLLA